MITIYSTELCPKCKVLKAKLTAKNIEFEEIQDQEEVARVAEETMIGEVPIIKIDDQYMNFPAAVNWINYEIQGE